MRRLETQPDGWGTRREHLGFVDALELEALEALPCEDDIEPASEQLGMDFYGTGAAI